MLEYSQRFVGESKERVRVVAVVHSLTFERFVVVEFVVVLL